MDLGSASRVKLNLSQQSMTAWADCINSHSKTDVTLLDLSKAFDSVPHQRLLLKLDYYGICGKSAVWIKAFLSNRSQVVSVNGSHSSPQPVSSGVPQDSILRPVLFLLYINDITEHIQSTMHLFADDSIVYREIKNICDHALLQQNLTVYVNGLKHGTKALISQNVITYRGYK